MYNEEIKQAYLRTLDKKASTRTRSLFDKSEAFECFKGKDLSKLAKNDILYLLTSFKTTSKGFLIQRNQQIRDYKKWFLETFKDTEVTQFEINKQDYQRCLKMNEVVFFTEKEIDLIIQAQPSPITKFLIQALFEGIRGTYLSEIILAKIEDVNKSNRTMKVYNCKDFDENNQVITEERIVAISDKLITLMEECVETDKIIDKDGVIKGYLDNSEYIVKYRRDKEDSDERVNKEQLKIKARALSNRLTHSIYEGNPPLTSSKIFASGIIEQLKNKDISFIEQQYNVTKEYIKELKNNV